MLFFIWAFQSTLQLFLIKILLLSLIVEFGMNVNGLWDSTTGSPTRWPITQNVSHSRRPSVSLRLGASSCPVLPQLLVWTLVCAAFLLQLSAFRLWVPRDWDSCFNVSRVDAELCLVD